MNIKTNRKYQILESLEELDQAQADKVLDYIKALLTPTADEKAYQNFKRNALQEIRRALRDNSRLNTAH